MIKIKAMALLFVCVSTMLAAQDRYSIKIGDRVPDLELPKIINYFKPTAKISDFKGKAIVLDFWAPWCSPCIAAFPKLDSLQRKFQDKLQIIPITGESGQFANQVMRNIRSLRGTSLNFSVVEDTIVNKIFAHKIIPHYVWIDTSGRLRGMTGSEDVTEANLLDLINSNELDIPVKNDFENNLDFTKPFFTDMKLAEEGGLFYHSILTGYIQGIPVVATQRKTWIRCTNHPIILLYKVAFGKFSLKLINNNRMILEGFETREDSLMVGRYSNGSRSIWKEVQYENTYNYQLMLPDSSFSSEEKFQMMQEDLNRMFASKGIKGDLEKRSVKVLVLERTRNRGSLKIKTLGGAPQDLSSNYFLKIVNRPISSFVVKMQAFFSKDGILPIENETKIKENVDIEINADLTDIDAVNNELKKFDLRLVERTRIIDMIVIKKAKQKRSNKQ